MAKQKSRANEDRWQIPFGFFAGPVLWGIQLLVGYILVPVACRVGSNWPVYLPVGISGLVVLLAALVAYRSWSSSREAQDSLLVETNEARTTGTFLAVSGFSLSLLFFLAILGTFLTGLFLSPCPVISMIFP